MIASSTPRLAVVMVGLPARGKSFISSKVARYLQWLGITTKIFNVGTYRRKQCGAQLPASFFDPANQETAERRNNAANSALSDMLEYLEHEGLVGIYDATNSTRERRDMVVRACESRNIEVMFLESICDDQALIMDNIRDVKLSSPDYAETDPDQAAEDFLQRIAHYNSTYQTVAEDEGASIKVVNAGRQYKLHEIRGFLQSRIVFFLMNVHVRRRFIYLSRHGESEFNVLGRIGGDADLSPRGREYAMQLAGFFDKELDGAALTVWTSTFKRTQQTGQHLPFRKLAWRQLDEIDAGVCDGLTYEEIADRFPEDFAARDDDKFNYRYRGGESYHDLVLRLEPVIMELERQENILVIGHQAVLRAIYAYFLNYPLEELPYIEVPLHTVIKLTPHAYGTKEERFPFKIDAVSTHRDPRRECIKMTAPVAHPPPPMSLSSVSSPALAATTVIGSPSAQSHTGPAI